MSKQRSISRGVNVPPAHLDSSVTPRGMKGTGGRHMGKRAASGGARDGAGSVGSMTPRRHEPTLAATRKVIPTTRVDS